MIKITESIYVFFYSPVRLQYAYLYDYRHNYYDDVIDYLDKRQRGIHRSIPTAQTWAERALRTYNVRNKTTEDFHKREQDITLLSDIRTSSRFYRYHSKDYYTTKYMSILWRNEIKWYLIVFNKSCRPTHTILRNEKCC